MNILLINHYAGSKQHGMEYRPYYLSRAWVKQGHQVTIAASSFSHLRNLKPDFPGLYACEVIDGIRYVWLKTPPYSGNGFSRVKNIFTFLLRLSLFQNQVVQGQPPDLVIASSTYPFDIFPAFQIKRKTGARLVFEVHDLWPLTPIEIGGMSPLHPFIALMQMAEDFAYKKADRVVSILPLAKSYMERHGMAPEKFAHIPNGIETSEWEKINGVLPSLHATTIDSLKKKGFFLVGYAGGLGQSNALQFLVEAASMLREIPVFFVLIGSGPEKENLETLIETKASSNIKILPPIQKELIPTFLAKMDALYLGWLRTPLYRFGISPNKLMDYMMAGKPILHSVEAGNDPVRDAQCGLSIPPEEPQEIAQSLIKLVSLDKSELCAMGKKGKDYVMANHDYYRLADRFLESVMS